MFRTTLTLALAVLAPSACTTVIVQAPAADDTGEDSTSTASADSSTGEPSPPREDTSTSTSDDTSGSTSGEDTSDTSTSTGPASTSTSGAEDTSTSGDTTDAPASTSTDTDTSDTSGSGSTGEPAPAKGLGAECSGDNECASAWCSNNLFDQNAPQQCTAACDPAMPSACTVGVCINAGNDSHRCSGAWPVTAYKIAGIPYQDNPYIAASEKAIKPVVSYYVAAQPAAYKLEVSAIDNPGYGPAKVDAYNADGSLIGTASQGAPLTIDPTADYVILVLQAASDAQSLANLYLKSM